MDEPLCPPWWPRILWDLHYIPRPGGVNPVNYPPVVDDIMASLTIHTMSYLLLDQKAAQQYRSMAEEQIAQGARSMSRLHEEAAASRRGPTELGTGE